MIRRQRLPADARDHLGAPDHGPPDRMAAEDRLRDDVVDEVLRVVVDHRDLLEHDLALGVDVGEGRVVDHPRHHVERRLEAVVRDPGVDERRLARRGGVQLAAEAVEDLRDLLRRVCARALEEQVLDEVGDPGARIRLVARAGADPEAERDRADVRDVLGDDAFAGRKRREVVRLHRPILVAPCVLLFRLVVATGAGGRTPSEVGLRPITVLRRTVLRTLALAPVLAALALPWGASADAATLPPGFQESIVFSGLTNPTVVRFSPDGRVFVAEKSGLIKVFDNLTDPTPTVFADLSTQVHNFWDRGLLGLALDPSFPTNALRLRPLRVRRRDRRHGAALGDRRASLSDPCPTPPGATADGCVVSGRLSRLQAAGNAMTGHRAGADRGLVPAVPEPLDRQPRVRRRRRALRQRRRRRQLQLRRLGPGRQPAQPVRRPARRRRRDPDAADRRGRRAAQPGPAHLGRPASLDGALLRVDPATGAALPDNPLAFSSDPNARRIVAHGLRNPFRIASGRGTNEVWVGDVGWNTWEEIDRVDPAGRGRQLRLALLRGRRPPVGATTAPT